MLRFRVLGASFSRFGCFVLRSSFSSASFSKLPYIVTPLQTNLQAIKEINKLFFIHFFLLNGKKDKINRSIMINDYPEGGLKMIDIASFNKSLKATRIKKYLYSENRGKWKEGL